MENIARQDLLDLLVEIYAGHDVRDIVETLILLLLDASVEP